MTDVDAVVARCYTRYLFVSLALYIRYRHGSLIGAVIYIKIRAWDWTFVSLDVQVKMGLDPHVQLSACTRTCTCTPYVG